MPKRWPSMDEWYPVLTLDAQENDFFPTIGPVEFTDEEIADLNRITNEFTDWQKKIAERFGFESPRPGAFALDDPDEE